MMLLALASQWTQRPKNGKGSKTRINKTLSWIDTIMPQWPFKTLLIQPKFIILGDIIGIKVY